MRPIRLFCGLLLVPVLSLSGSRSAAQAQAPATPDFENAVQSLLAKNCMGCHNPARKTGGLDLEPFKTAAVVLEHRDTFEKIARRLKAGEMPPKGSPRPDEAAVEAATSWLEAEFDRADLSVKPTVQVLARRLNRTEYNNTIRDLLGIRSRPADEFPPDDSALGFDNIAQALAISPSLMEKYLATAERVAREAVFGPRPKKDEVAVFYPPVPRRMEYTNRLKVEPPAYYTMFDYDETGLSQPGSLHLTYEFPVDGEYLFRVVGANFRPNGSEPGQMDFRLDGELIRSFPINEAEQSGFERRPDFWDIPLTVSAGPHQIVVAFPKQFDGLPPIFKGPNPSTRPFDPCRLYGTGGGGGGNRCVAELLKQPPDPDPLRESRRLENIERAKAEQNNPRPFEGFAVHELYIHWPKNYTQRPLPDTAKKIFICGSPTDPYDASCERSILSNLATRAYRRPATSQEVQELQAIAAGARSRGGSFAEGISVAVAAVLASPNFLFRIDRPVDVKSATAQHDLASRLSYFLWSSMPDEELMRAAAQGILSRPEVLEEQVRRLMADPKSQAFVENFAAQWLEIRRLESQQPDRERYPDFDEYLRASMKKETELFFAHIMREDRPVVDFIDGSYSFLNERLARHYGIRGVTGTEFRKVDFTGTPRAGILTQASVLTVSSYGNRTSPVLRGKWVLENILNAPPPPPPGDVPSLNEDAVGSAASLRQELEEHRTNPTCASCHARMDPLGFGLENYNAVGAWRTQDGKFDIDASGTLPNGKSFHGALGLVGILTENKDAFVEGLTEKVMTYALGRGLERYDRALVRQIVKSMAAHDYRFSSLVLGIVNSAPFQMKNERPQP